MIETLLDGVRRILCIGAHCDDIEIGCGGTILRLLAANPGIHVDWVVLTSNPEREAEARSTAETILAEGASATVSVETFRGRFLPYVAADVKEYFDSLGERCNPDVVFTHFGEDLHQDHRLACELTYNTFRDHLILEYEIPKYDGDIGRPNAYVCLTREQCEQKVTTIVEGFPTQSDKYWLNNETFWALLRLRGIEAKSPSGYAEGFYSRKIVLA
jgi:LmbE family N-acetylglucosaminyl deacetylase